MKGGKSRIQRAMVLASGKLRFVKNIGARRERRGLMKKFRKSVKARSNYEMAVFATSKTGKKTRRLYNLTQRRGKGHSRRGSLTIPVAPVLGLAASLIEPLDHIAHADVKGGLQLATMAFTGFDFHGTFDPWRMKQGVLPVAVGLAVHYIVGNKLGANRMLGRAKVPLLRI